jgi:hypothetical protein
VELFEQVRRDQRAGLSIRKLAEKHHVHRRTVPQAHLPGAEAEVDVGEFHAAPSPPRRAGGG